MKVPVLSTGFKVIHRLRNFFLLLCVLLSPLIITLAWIDQDAPNQIVVWMLMATGLFAGLVVLLWFLGLIVQPSLSIDPKSILELQVNPSGRKARAKKAGNYQYAGNRIILKEGDAMPQSHEISNRTVIRLLRSPAHIPLKKRKQDTSFLDVSGYVIIDLITAMAD